MQNQEKLNQAIADFELWRQNRTNKHARIPDKLRSLAIELLEEYRIGKVTKALRICSSQSNAWRKQLPAKQPIPDFVSLQVDPALPYKPDMNLQLTLPNSSQLCIRGALSTDLLRALIHEAGGL